VSSGAPQPADVGSALSSIGAALQQIGAALAALAADTPGSRVVSTAPLSLTTPRPSDDVTVADAVNQFLVSRARVGRSDRYLRQLRVVLAGFAKGRASHPVAKLLPADVERWLDSHGWQPKTRRGYLADVRAWLAWCERRAWISSNPARALDAPALPPQGPPAIHTPEEASRVLAAARPWPDVLRLLAIRYFCGLRSSEAERLRESHLLLDRGYVEVPAAMAKTRRRRLVAIPDNLRAWLALDGTLRGIRPSTVREVIRSSGVAWPHNVTRHSWCSYHLAMHQAPGRTALEAGHSEAMLFGHYRELVTREDAARYFDIRPT
jgi:integrase